MNPTLEQLLGPALNFFVRYWLHSIVSAVVVTLISIALVRGFRERRKLLFCLLGAELLPVVVLTICLLLSKAMTHALNATTSYAVLIVCLGVGIWSILRAPVRPLVRIVASVVYTPLMACFLFGYALFFACFVFGDCL